MREQFSSNFEGVFLTGCVLQDVKASQVRAILDYMYRGEVSVAQDELPSLLRVAEMLKVKGMTEENTKADTKLPAPRCSSPGSGAPPNSIVPPNGESPVPTTDALDKLLIENKGFESLNSVLAADLRPQKQLTFF